MNILHPQTSSLLQFDILMIWMHLLARVFLSLLIKCESHFFLWCYLYFASCFYSVSQFKLQLPYLSHYTTSVHNESISLSYRLKRINQISWQHCTFFIFNKCLYLAWQIIGFPILSKLFQNEHNWPQEVQLAKMQGWNAQLWSM